MIERDIVVDGGRILRTYDGGARSPEAPVLFWHHGSPQTGAILEPIAVAAERRGIRVISYARPGYPGSTPDPGRRVASAAADVARIADRLGIARFGVMGASGGGPHALACAALLPDRVLGAVGLAAIAPLTDRFDWWAGMASNAGLRAAVDGGAARARFAETEEFVPESFIPADWEALSGAWASLGADAGAAGEAGPDGLVDDDVAFAADWGFDPAGVLAPTLLVQGGLDRVVPAAHARHLLEICPNSELWYRPRDGHISVLAAVPVAMDWLLDRLTA